jgi:catechol 2,3-dioxygenase-like lactoylglutathione lyase family enzyme
MDGVSYVRISPTLPVRDINKAVEFYEKALGLELRSSYGEPPNFAIVGTGDVFIQLSLDREGSMAGKVGCYITVKGVDAVFERCKAAGADLDSDLAVRDYGMKDFVVHDADENHVIVGENTA